MTEYSEVKGEALTALREVARLAEDAGALSLARTLRGERIPRLEDERFHLVVLGEFNHGKTTFVNALLGASVLPAGVTPTTAVIHRIRYAETRAARALREDGDPIEVPFEQLANYVVDGSASKDDVSCLEVDYPAPLLEQGVTLVDTPGVNDMNDARSEITYGYIPRSDAVLFLLDAGQILKESERQFIAGKLLAGSRDKVLFIVNKMDLLSDEEREEALAYARVNLGRIIDEPKVWGVSAEQALEGDREGSGLDAFVGDLTTFLQEERGRVLVDHALEAGQRTAHTLRSGIEIQRRALAMDNDELARRLASLEEDLESSAERIAEREKQIREACAAVKAVVRQDVESFGRRFALALPEEIESSEAKNLRRYLAGFIEEKFREFAEGQAEDIARRLEKVAEEAIAFVTDDARARAERLNAALGPAAPRLDLEVNTFAYDVGVFAVGAFGVTLMVLSNVLVGGAMTLAAPVLAYILRGRVDKQVKAQALEEAPKVVKDAAGKMAEAFDVRIDEFADRLVAFVQDANEEMTRSIAELVRTAREAREDGSEAEKELESGASMALVRLTDVDQRMEVLRKSLWTNGATPPQSVGA